MSAAPNAWDSNGADRAIRAVQLLGRLDRGARRIGVVDFGTDGGDSATNNLAESHSGRLDVWGKLRPGHPGYTYDGKRNMRSDATLRRRKFR